MRDATEPIGVVLAGGIGRRIGGGKATVALRGTPLVAYPVAALQAVLADIAVVAKRDTTLPLLPRVRIWTEPDTPRHPLAGIVHALAAADGRELLVCAGDLPFVSTVILRTLIDADPAGALAVVPRAGGRLQPLLARYLPQARAPLAAALTGPDRAAPLTEHVAALAPRVLDVDDERPFFNVNLPEDLLTAAALLDGDP